MKLSEIAERLVKLYPDSSLAKNECVITGCRDQWYEEDLIEHLLNFFNYEILKLCGCGIPENTDEAIYQLLKIRKDWLDHTITYEEKKERYKSDMGLDVNKDMHYGLVQFVLYVLNEVDLLEHGSSVGGSWLTDLGEMYFCVLEARHNQYGKG